MPLGKGEGETNNGMKEEEKIIFSPCFNLQATFGAVWPPRRPRKLGNCGEGSGGELRVSSFFSFSCMGLGHGGVSPAGLGEEKMMLLQEDIA